MAGGQTTIINSSLIAIICLAVITLLWHSNRNRFHGLSCLPLAFALQFFAVLLLCGLTAFAVWGIAGGWRNRSLPGNAFRQTQTAITALFVQREHDFALAYPTPVLGKPWSVPFEFPLYQWTVAVVSASAEVQRQRCRHRPLAVATDRGKFDDQTRYHRQPSASLSAVNHGS